MKAVFGRGGALRYGLALVLAAIILGLAGPYLLGMAFLNLGNVELHRAVLREELTAKQRAEGLRAAEGHFSVAADQLGATALRGLGRAYLEAQEYPDAVKALSRALELAPGDQIARLEMGQAYDGLEDRDKAVEIWRGITPDTYFLQRGDVALRERRPVDAIADYQRHIAIAPGRPEGYQRLGRAYAALGRADEAIAAYEKAIAVDPEYAAVYHDLGIFYTHEKPDLEKAVYYYEKAIRYGPGDLLAYIRLGEVLMGQGRHEEAARWFSQAAVQFPGSWRPHHYLGVNYMRQGKPQEAIEEFLQALERDDQETMVHEWLAEAYRATGQREKAIAEWRAVLQLAPGNARAQEELEKLLK